MKSHMKKLVIALIATLSLSACATSKPIAINKSVKRDIPLSLFTGMKEGETKKVHKLPTQWGIKDLVLTGPTEWLDERNGEKLTIYTRDRVERGRNITQYFAVTEDGTGIGRVYDSRWPNMVQRGEVKFPLGEWYQGEVREYKTIGSNIRVTIVDINYKGNGIKFSWQAFGQCYTYGYLPERGMVYSSTRCESS